MLCFPNAKINLGLRILGRRSDGYHSISSFMLPVGLKDALEILPGGTGTELQLAGLLPPGESADNLVIKAWKLMQVEYGIGGADIHLLKGIPYGAGLGGGSSDAASVLIAVNELFELKLDTPTLLRLAARIGSDCPFFIQRSPCLASGRGEELSLVKFPRKDIRIMILKPLQGISTAEAYSSIKSYSAHEFAVEDLLMPLEQWKEHFINDFEVWAATKVPQIAGLITFLYEKGAFYAAMSGSGSSVFGLFTSDPPDTGLPPACFHWRGSLV